MPAAAGSPRARWLIRFFSRRRSSRECPVEAARLEDRIVAEAVLTHAARPDDRSLDDAVERFENLPSCAQRQRAAEARGDGRCSQDRSSLVRASSFATFSCIGRVSRRHSALNKLRARRPRHPLRGRNHPRRRAPETASMSATAFRIAFSSNVCRFPRPPAIPLRPHRSRDLKSIARESPRTRASCARCAWRAEDGCIA